MKKSLIVVIVAIVLALGVGGYFVLGRKASQGTGSSSDSPKSLKDLLSSGVAQKCTFSNKEDSNSSEGTTYVSGGKVRGDFTTVTSNKTVKSHMISDGTTSYIWTDGEKTGFKMTVTKSDDETETSPVDKTSEESVDLNQKADYKCSAWVVDGSFFTPPSDVKFTDFSQMLNPTPASGAKGGSSQQCAYCANLSGDDKTQCLKALNCN
jgi:hypothetical protein